VGYFAATVQLTQVDQLLHPLLSVSISLAYFSVDTPRLARWIFTGR